MGMNGAIANSDSSIVYVFNSYGPSGLQYPQFFGLNSTDGTTVTATIF